MNGDYAKVRRLLTDLDSICQRLDRAKEWVILTWLAPLPAVLLVFGMWLLSG